HLSRLGSKARRLRRERPAAAAETDDRKPAFIVGGGGEAVRRRVRIFGGDGGALDRLTAFVLHGAAGAAGLRRYSSRERSHDERRKRGTRQRKMIHTRDPRV